MQHVIPVFIASPGDVQEEREHCRIAIERLSPRLLRLFGVGLAPVDWRDFAPDADSEKTEVFQYRILRDLVPDSLFIGIVYQRVGSPISGSTKITGTEAEYDYAIRNRNRIRILTYMRSLDGIAEDQLQVSRLRKKIRDAELPRQPYSTVEEFADRIMLDLLEAVTRGILGDEGRRRRLYREFFRFGSRRPQSPESPPLIVYPPIHKHDSRAQDTKRPNYDWRRRLLPNVVYEDFKAAQKVETALRTIGIRDFRTVTTLYPPAATDAGNRIWLCLPRNAPAQRELTRLGRRVRFQFDHNSNGERFIRWGRKKTVQSPLANYLSLQRPGRRRPWQAKFGRVIAKDFAVLARFPVRIGTVERGSPFYHYYLAGIRGLGTWGAGWYIDRYPDALAQQSEKSRSGDVQILLEVTFYDHKIVHVENVSNKRQDHFDAVNNQETIRAEVEKHSR